MRDFLIKTALKAGKSLKHNFRQTLIKQKKDEYGDIVTNADFEAEKIIIDAIKKNYPKYNILSEEAGYFNNNSAYTLIVDPLDGTKNFARNIVLFGTTIALAHKNKIIEGIIYDPVHNELFYAKKGKGAFLNNKRIKVSNKNTLENFIGGVANVRSKTDSAFYNRLKNKFYKQSGGWRILGSAVLDLAWLAAGRMDLFILGGVCPWDVAAGGLLIEEAGGIITQIDGKKWEPLQERQEIIACCSKKMYKNILKTIN
jgi:myo-inositol-1(or 4)-monophosphatase